MAKYKYSINEIKNWFLSKESMTPKKLQKLLYYAYSWDMVFENEDADNLDVFLFNNEFKAWVHGPVIPAVWREYRGHKWNEIEQLQEDNSETFDKDTLDTLNQVWEEYGVYNGNELESITHQEKPWIEAREGLLPLDRSSKTIDNRTIFEYYCKRLAG